MFNNIYVNGSAVFLNLCASDILLKKKVIFYLINFASKKHKVKKAEINFIKTTANFFNYKVVFKKNKNIKINNNDMISSNLIKYFLPHLSGQSIKIFPEGTSCLNKLLDESVFIKLYNHLKKIIRRIFIGHYNVKTYFIIPDFEGRVLKFFLKKKDKTLKLLPTNTLKYNLIRYSKYFIKKNPELKIKEKQFIFHPFVNMPYKQINWQTYKEWFTRYRDFIGKKKVYVKLHQDRNYFSIKKIFSEFKTFIVPTKFVAVPAELLLINTNSTFLGCYSSILTIYKKKNTKIINPPSKELTKLFNSEFKLIKKVLCI
jgi:hypothetical protein